VRAKAIYSLYAFLTFFSSSICVASIHFPEHTIADSIPGWSVYAIDINGDSDVDILGASVDAIFTWWENDGDEEFTEHIISDEFVGLRCIFAIDIDNDDDIDVLGATGNTLVFFDNTEGDGSIWTTNIISEAFGGARYIYAYDIDSDGDIDVLGAAQIGDEISWWENDGNENFTEHTIQDNFDAASSVHADDIDGDGDVDVLGAAFWGDNISWWENDGNMNFTRHTVIGQCDGAFSALSIDLDDDDDIDILGSAYNDFEIYWCENDGNENFTTHLIDEDIEGPQTILGIDMDSDGDKDVVCGIFIDDSIIWWENDGDENFTGHTVTDSIDGPYSIYTCDIDGDEDNDIVGVTVYSEEVIWWENIGRPPNDFELASPPDNAIVHEDTVAVFWNLTTDDDPNDEIEYIIDWSSDNDFPDDDTFSDTTNDTSFVISDLEELMTSIFDIPHNVSNGELDELPDDQSIYWRVRAIDNSGIYTWANGDSAGWLFTTDLFDSPLHFSLLQPSIDDTCWTLDTILVWDATTDPDAYDTPHYDVWFGTEPDLSNAELVIDSTDETSLEVTDLIQDQLYYWTVRATDSNTPGTWAEDTLSFFAYDPEPPDGFSLSEPENGYELTGQGDFPLVFRWESANDPDPNDRIHYTLELSTNSGFIDPEVYDIGSMDTLALGNLEISTYWWRVKAVDRFDLETYSSQTWILQVTLSVQERKSGNIPSKYSIAKLFPNPFNPTLSISIGLPISSELKVSIFNIIGQEVAVVAEGTYSTGYQKLSFDGKDQPSGIYFIHAEVPGKMHEVRKVVLMR